MLKQVRPWSGPGDTGAMQRLASRCWPQGPHPGGLGWAHATGQLAAEIVVVDDPHADGELAGWAGVTQPGSLVLQAAPTDAPVLVALLDWLLATATGAELRVETYDGPTRDAVRRRAFVAAEPPFGYYRMGEPGLRAAVDEVEGTRSPGYAIRAVRPDEATARVEVHRAAWRPADLPIAPAHRPAMDDSWTSSFTTADYRRVRAAGLYDQDLDLVVVAPDGSLAGCCIGWFDPRTGWAEIEPLGVVPAHRRRGLAGALCAEVAARVARRGGRYVYINTAASDMYPAPYAIYTKAGFVPYVRSAAYVRSAEVG